MSPRTSGRWILLLFAALIIEMVLSLFCLVSNVGAIFQSDTSTHASRTFEVLIWIVIPLTVVLLAIVVTLRIRHRP